MIFYSILARICRKSKKKPQKKGGFWVFYDPESVCGPVFLFPERMRKEGVSVK